MADKSRQAGFTLIEVLIYTFILSMFLLLTTQIFITIKLSNANSMALNSLQKNYRQILTDLTRTIKAAEGVEAPLSQQSDSTLSLNNGSIVYRLNNGVMQKVVAGEEFDLTTREVTVTNLNFENTAELNQTDIIKISLDLESNYLLEGGRSVRESLQTTVSLR